MSVVASCMSFGTRVWLVAGTTDLRQGFTATARWFRTRWRAIGSVVMSSSFADGAAICSSCYHGTKTGLCLLDGETLGVRPIRLAASAEWKCLADGSATVDASPRESITGIRSALPIRSSRCNDVARNKARPFFTSGNP